MGEELIEKKVSSEDIFDGTLLHVKRDTVTLPNGNQATREWISHPGASSILPLTPEGEVILVRQYRYPIGKITLEVPAGKLDAPDEDPLVCAKRELSEETGYEAKTITKLSTIATTVGFSNEYIHMYMAEGLTPGKQHPDEDEFINVVKMPLKEAVAMVLDGRICDAKSAASILLVERRLREKQEK
ncbi:NUDIX domain-containing protein [Selenomonas ruminis]|uniref:NUDIX hydrolase n=1 Tax=Selenomonas ruminis TaxID=2593411 RepID=A0A5D6WD25_9FIRM|nr:NUDIX hydrolase [Selenomonas sp. mPRGC5]TYZ24748.1 NUDIX hydrolase [Selenomonas sp. mPRGC5]